MILYLPYIIWGALAILTFLQITKTISRSQAIKRAQQELEKAIKEQEQAKVELHQKIANLYGDQISKQIQKGDIWTGMPTHLLLASKGKADSIKSSGFENNIVERWYYALTPQRRLTQKHPIEIRLQNEKIISWFEY